MRLVLVLIIAGFAVAAAQTPIAPLPSQNAGEVYICPMDPDIRSHDPGNCSRCGMALVAGLPDPVEYHLNLSIAPKVTKPGQRVRLSFEIQDPWKKRPVAKFQTIHEKLFHMFVVSQDLQVFEHNHPVLGSDGKFHYDYVFPKAGMYRVLGDFYPDGGTPQLIAKSVIIPGQAPKPVALQRDYSPKDTENLRIELTTDPDQPISGSKTQMHFRLNPGDGVEKYLGAWGHMLVASSDLIDMIHEHPFIADGGPEVQFNVIFPRAKPYRVWVQFQRKGVVNTAHFDVNVKQLGQ